MAFRYYDVGWSVDEEILFESVTVAVTKCDRYSVFSLNMYWNVTWPILWPSADLELGSLPCLRYSTSWNETIGDSVHFQVLPELIRYNWLRYQLSKTAKFFRGFCFAEDKCVTFRIKLTKKNKNESESTRAPCNVRKWFLAMFSKLHWHQFSNIYIFW